MFTTAMLVSFRRENKSSILISIETSLTLLNVKALNAALSADILVLQKLIRKNDVNPMSSQPRYITIRFPLETNKTILITNKFIKSINLSTLGSYLK